MGDGISLEGKLGSFEDHWAPRTVAKFNGHAIMVVKVKGEFVWHKHDDTDDFFLVLKGRLTLRLRDRDVVLTPGNYLSFREALSTCRQPRRKLTFF